MWRGDRQGRNPRNVRPPLGQPGTGPLGASPAKSLAPATPDTGQGRHRAPAVQAFTTGGGPQEPSRMEGGVWLGQ